MDWTISEAYDPARVTAIANRYFSGNGFMGVRGTVDEAGPEQTAAVNIAGLYDGQPGKWRETVNAPNMFYGYIAVDDEVYEAGPDNTTITLDFRTGGFRRTTSYETRRGTVTLETGRFVSMSERSLGGQTYRICADFHADIRLLSGIDCNIWDINGPHLKDFEYSGEPYLSVRARTCETGRRLTCSVFMETDFPCQQRIVNENNRLLYEWNFVTDPGRVYSVHKLGCVTVSCDGETDDKTASEVAGEHGSSKCRLDSYLGGDFRNTFNRLLSEHRKVWEGIWADSEVVIEGDDEARSALNYSIYQLYSIAPVPGSGMSIPARGLSGQTYKGAVFWDTEIFMMDLFINTRPEIARELIMYRINGLEGAMDKAKSYGHDGAFYAWESQEDGRDACSDYNVTDVFTGRPMRTYFRDRQVHISAAIVYAIDSYLRATGDISILDEGGRKVIIECARFYLSLLWQHPFGDVYEIHGVIGPDEYHERVDNNAYTNAMARYTWECALKVVGNEYSGLAVGLKTALERLPAPRPDEDGIIPQFDGYRRLEDTTPDVVRTRLLDPKEYWGGAYGVAAETQVIKQADVIALMALKPELFTRDIIKKNWLYYEPRTEHGSSLSTCMYGLTACECGMTDRAYEMFMRSAKADLTDGGKEWAGLVYIGGIHPAAHGGAYMLAVRGFAGLTRDCGRLMICAGLPAGWKSMCFCVRDHGKKYRVKIEGTTATLKEC